VPTLSLLLTNHCKQVGDVVEGVVAGLRPYGAFLDLGNGAVGLLHVSQISHERIISVDKILREGDRLKVRDLSIFYISS
jgi:small subunit ribosomal protein S1